MMRARYGLAVAAGLAMFAPGSALAFNCAVPGLINPAKKAVCSNQLLSAINDTERSAESALRAKLPFEARRELSRDRRVYVAARDQCRADERCLEATMRAQIRLHRKLEACTANEARALVCTSRTIQSHRMDLHRSM